MRSILLIGADGVIPFLRGLEQDGFEVTIHRPGDPDAPDAEYDVVIVDLSSAGEDATAVRYTEKAQSGESPPVLAVMTQTHLDAYDPTRELDDFVLASAPAAELCARVRQALWKRHRLDARNILKCGDLQMDLANYTVHVAGRPVELTYKEYELLRFLATNRGRVFNRETLLSKVWGYDFYGGARTVDVHVRRLRSKIEDRHNVFIETVRNVGYRFRASG